MPYICIHVYLKKAVFSPPALKWVAHSILRAEFTCLTTCISYKHPILTDLLLAYHFVSH